MIGLEYRELTTAPALRPYIECYWTLHAYQACPAYPVLPDGCADLLFSDEPNLQLVGSMTAARAVPLAKGADLFGIRFRPAMAPLFLKAPWQELTDEIVCATGTTPLAGLIADRDQPAQRVAVVENWLRMVKAEGPVQRMMSRGVASARMDDLSRSAGLSARQLRRLFLTETGLSPKHLFRILRFRRALQHMSRQSDFARLALDAGYYDQAHFIHEFREFSGGFTPAAWRSRMTDFSNPGRR